MDDEEEVGHTKKEKKQGLSYRAEFSAFGKDLEMMVDSKRLAMNNLTIFDHHYMQEPRYGLLFLECLYNFYRYPRSMIGSIREKEGMDKKFRVLRDKLWEFEAYVESKERVFHIYSVRKKIKEKYREIRAEMSKLMDDTIELAQNRGLGIPATANISTISKLDVIRK